MVWGQGQVCGIPRHFPNSGQLLNRNEVGDRVTRPHVLLAVAKVPFNLLHKTPSSFEVSIPTRLAHKPLVISRNRRITISLACGDRNASSIHFPNAGDVCFPEWSLSDSTVDVSTSKTTKARDNSSVNSLHLNSGDIEEVSVLFLYGFEEGMKVVFSFAFKIKIKMKVV